jgi:hypothetical protein
MILQFQSLFRKILTRLLRDIFCCQWNNHEKRAASDMGRIGDMKQYLAALDQILNGQPNLLIVLLNNPDALASGFALRYLAEKWYDRHSSIIVYRSCVFNTWG